jgi:aryl-alcohol dehydrogenase-like predicted oxidoreductase
MSALPRTPLFPGGPDVARISLGTMMFGDRTEAPEAERILSTYLAQGGNLIDTADSYAGGGSETMLGSLLQGRRDDVILATKLGNPVAGIAGSGGLSARWVTAAVEGSLRRLRTDRIDLYWLHLDDVKTPLEETLAAIACLIAQGKVLNWGFSNFRAWKIAEMVRVADQIGCPRPVAAQPYYHMLNRTAEAEFIPACAHFGIGVIPYSPLARGVLTGKYAEAIPEGSRADRADRRLLEVEFRPPTLHAAKMALAHADGRGRELSHLAVQWVLANAAVVSVLAGPRTLQQMEGYLAAMDCAFDAQDEAILRALCGAGQTPGEGQADPRYPYTGRPLRKLA